MTATDPIVKRKVYAYITHGHRLLVFSHPDSPEAGIQVPGGTVEPGEDPAVAVLREAEEETGLCELVLDCFLGAVAHQPDHDSSRCTSGEVHHRDFYHVRCHGEPPLSWRSYERFASTSAAPIAFDCFWASLPDGVPTLAAELGSFLPQLLAVLDGPQAEAEIDWQFWEALVNARGVVVDRTRDSPHPRFPQSRYPVDYGYLPDTVGGDGQPVDVFVGSAPERGLAGLIATHDALKQDEEIKLLWRTTEREVAAVLAFINRGQMTGRLARKPAPDGPRSSPCASL